MVIIADSDGINRTNELHAWTAANRSGFIINLKTGKSLKVHNCVCNHFEDPRFKSLTKAPKLCFVNKSELKEWILKQTDKVVDPCKKCQSNYWFDLK
jgi:hypothetical protein